MYFQLIATSVLPVIALIIIGFILRKYKFPSIEFWEKAGGFSHSFLFPVMFFGITANFNFKEYNFSKLITVIVITIIIIHFILYFIALFVKEKNRPAFTSIYQGSFRFNGSMAIAMFFFLFGNTGQAFIATIACFTAPIINGLCIYFLSKYGNHGKKVNVIFIIKEISLNPLFIFTMLGFLVNFMGIKIPTLPNLVIGEITKIAVPFSLLILGAALKFGDLTRHYRGIIASSFVKFGVYFVVVYLVANKGFGIVGQDLKMLLLFSLHPCSVVSYLFAEKLGGDKSLMASIIFSQVIISSFAIIAFLYFYTDAESAYSLTAFSLL